MHLDEINLNITSKRLNVLLKEHFDSQLNLNQLTIKKAKIMKQLVTERLDKVRNTKQFHSSERDSSYVNMLVLEQLLGKWIVENDFSPHKEVMQRGMKQSLNQLSNVSKQGLEKITGSDFNTSYHAPALKDIWSIKQDKTKKYNKQEQPSTYNYYGEMTDKQIYNYFYGKSIDDLVNNKFRFANTESATRIEAMLKAINAYGPKKFINFKQENPTMLSTMRHVYDAWDKDKKITVAENRRKYLKNRLFEGQMGNAEVVLAARDLVDRIQDMVEDLSKMLNEELPVLSDTIRDVIGNESSEQFIETAKQVLGSTLETLTQSRGEMDTASRILAGDEVSEPNELNSDEEMANLGDEGEEDLNSPRETRPEAEELAPPAEPVEEPKEK